MPRNKNNTNPKKSRFSPITEYGSFRFAVDAILVIIGWGISFIFTFIFAGDFELTALIIMSGITLILLVYIIYSSVKLSREEKERIEDITSDTKKLSDETRNLIAYGREEHITMRKIFKEVLVYKNPENKIRIDITNDYELHNNSPNKYEHFVLNESTDSTDKSESGEPQITINNAPAPIPTERLEIHKYNLELVSGDKEKGAKDRRRWTIKIPLGIEAKGNGTLSIKEPETTNFPKLFEFKDGDISLCESISSFVHYPTEVLIFSIKLSPEIDNYHLAAQCIDDGYLVNYQVTDYSNQRVTIHEQNLREWGAVPKISADSKELHWEIHHPKLGYRYRLYFALEKKNGKTSITSQSQENLQPVVLPRRLDSLSDEMSDSYTKVVNENKDVLMLLAE